MPFKVRHNALTTKQKVLKSVSSDSKLTNLTDDFRGQRTIQIVRYGVVARRRVKSWPFDALFEPVISIFRAQ